MGKKNKKTVEWQDDNKPAERPKREDISKAFAKKRSKRPIINRIIMHFIFKTKIVPKKNSHRAGLSKYGKLYQYRSKSAVDSEDALHWEAKAQCKEPMILGRVQAVATFRKTRADCIGLLETLLDALQGVAYKDDKQVVRLSAGWDENGMLDSGQTAGVILHEF